MSTMSHLEAEARSCRVCEEALGFEPRPVVRLSNKAKVLIIGQAPGTRVHASGIPWDDRSGDRLRDWMGIDKATFYDSGLIAIMPMGFCFPGLDDKGGDKPPRPECAPLWHDRLLAAMPQIELTLLVGTYAQKRYLPDYKKKNLGETIRACLADREDRLALPHPSWRNTAWLKKHPWFETDVLDQLRERLRSFGVLSSSQT